MEGKSIANMVFWFPPMFQSFPYKRIYWRRSASFFGNLMCCVHLSFFVKACILCCKSFTSHLSAPYKHGVLQWKQLHPQALVMVMALRMTLMAVRVEKVGCVPWWCDIVKARYPSRWTPVAVKVTSTTINHQDAEEEQRR
jgi:hypothetical protein